MLDGSDEQTYKTNLRTHHLELTTPRTMPTRRIKDIYRVCYINLPHGNLLFASLSSPFISLLLFCCFLARYGGAAFILVGARVFCQLFLLKKSSAIATASSLTIVAIVELRQLLRPSLRPKREGPRD